MGALLCEHVQTHAMCAHVYIRPTALQYTASLKRSVIALAQVVEVLLLQLVESGQLARLAGRSLNAPLTPMCILYGHLRGRC